MKQERTILSLALGCALLAACTDTAGPGDDGTPAEVDAYVATLPTWEAFSPSLAATDMAIGEPSEPDVFTVGPTEFSCTTTPYSLAQTPDRVVVFNPDSEIFWLGSLLQGRGYRDGLGSLGELPVRQRAPLTLFIDLLSENVSRTVDNPDASSVASAIGELIEQAENAGHRAGSKTFFQQMETYSLRQASIDLGISARHLGTTVTTELSYEESREERTLTAYFVQQMFTSSMVLPQTPGDVFSEAFTAERLQEQQALGRIGPDNLPTYISNIVWGRMLMVTMTSTASFTEMRAALSASNEAIGSGTVSGRSLEVLQEAEIQVSAVGGADEGVENLIRTGQLGDYFDAGASLQQARPLSYTVRNLADNSIASVSETTEYNLRECAASSTGAIGAMYRLTFDKLLVTEDGHDRLVGDPGCDPATAPAPELYYSFEITHPDFGTKVLASLPKNKAVSTPEDAELRIEMLEGPFEFSLYDGPDRLQFRGTARDADGASSDLIGSWDESSLNYRYPIEERQRHFTRGANNCSVRLFLTITKVEDLFS